tara:strand:- start:1970 stop:2911 length:942 start_codon:yes stop_codon:yes gene_type:complete
MAPKVMARRRGKAAFETRTRVTQGTVARVAVPTAASTAFAYIYFDDTSLLIRSALDAGTLSILQADEAQFIQNFLTSMGLLFTILAGTAYSALYRQQEDIYEALFSEVTEAKSLLEQLCLIGAGRPFYGPALDCIKGYVKDDLRRLDVSPAELLSSKPSKDPLERIMLMTSVGVPSVIYDTLRGLRQARAYRLGAMQRKFPALGIALLYLLAGLELLAFPLLGAGFSEGSGEGILALQSLLFASLAGAHVLVLRIVQELWQSNGGVFNVDEVLQQMVFGLEEELQLRVEQNQLGAAQAADRARFDRAAPPSGW